jgi:hypothetical protein
VRAKLEKFIIEYLRIYIFVSVFLPGFYFALKAHEVGGVFYTILTLFMIASGALVLLKLPEVVGESKKL